MSRPPLLRYAVAIGTVVLALLLSLWLRPLIEPNPFLLFLAAVAFSSWYSGLRPTLLAIALAILACSYFLLPPFFSLILGMREILRVMGFVVVSMLIVVLGEARQRATAEVRRQREWLHITLSSIGDAVIATDIQGRVTFINAVAETLTGWKQADAQGQALEQVFKIVNETTRETVESPVSKVIRSGTIAGLANHTILIARDGTETPIDDSGAPISDARGPIIGVVLVFRDITERKQADNALHESETRFRSVADSAPVLIWMSGIDTLCSFFNQTWLDFTGRALEQELGNGWTESIHPDDFQYCLDTYRSAFHQRQEFSMEYRLRRADGAYRWLLDTGVPRFAPDGSFAGYIGSCIDITERRQVEEALRASEQRYRDLANAMPLIIWTAGSDGAVNYYNQSWFEYTGTTITRTGGWGWPAVVHPDDRQRSLDRWNHSVQSGEPYEIEYRFRRADGRYRWHLGRALPIRDEYDRIVAWIGTATDIDDKKRAEDALHFLAGAGTLLASSLDYETTLASVIHLVVPRIADWCTIDILEEDGTLRLLALAHVDPEKVQWAQELRQQHPINPDASVGAPNVVRTGQSELYPVITDELLISVARDTEELNLLRAVGYRSAMVVPLMVRGQVLGVITFVAAESQRYYGPDDLELAEQLARRAAVSIDNARLYREAQDSLRARQVFLSIASHELKTPLTALMGYASLLQRRTAQNGVLTERDRRALRVIVNQATRLNRLISALLDLSRIETGQLSIERQVFDLYAMARHGVEEVQPALERHTVSINHLHEPLFVEGDELRMEQVLQNLLQNAIKYSPEGGAITVLVQREDDWACLSVTDQGIGIPTEALPKLFHRFYRAPNVEAEHVSGIGIGLFIVKEIVSLHGGEVAATSTEGKGSTFTIRLPLSKHLPVAQDRLAASGTDDNAVETRA